MNNLEVGASINPVSIQLETAAIKIARKTEKPHRFT